MLTTSQATLYIIACETNAENLHEKIDILKMSRHTPTTLLKFPVIKNEIFFLLLHNFQFCSQFSDPRFKIIFLFTQLTRRTQYEQCDNFVTSQLTSLCHNKPCFALISMCFDNLRFHSFSC